MPVVTYILRDGSRRKIDALVGSSVMETAIFNNLRGINGECGGCLSCATCHVYVDPSSTAEPSPPGDDELQLLEGVATQRRPESRLSCQLIITPELQGLVVQIPDRQG